MNFRINVGGKKLKFLFRRRRFRFVYLPRRYQGVSLSRLIIPLVFFCAISLFAESPEKKLTVAVTLSPYAKIVREIAGNQADVVTLVPPNANPHTFEPRPATLRSFSAASIYLSDGSGLDAAWLPRFKGVNPGVEIRDISQGVSWMQEEHSHENGERAELDPHLWNSPRTALLVAANVCSVLVETDAPNAGVYRTNLEVFSKRLSDLDVKFSAAVKGLSEEKRTFIVFHPSYGYLARDYGLHQVAVEMDGKEPKPRDLQRLIGSAKKFQVKTIFVQPQFSRRAVESLSREIQAKIVSVDPLAYDFESELLKFLDALTAEAK